MAFPVLRLADKIEERIPLKQGLKHDYKRTPAVEIKY